jgi:hypothetical protein
MIAYVCLVAVIDRNNVRKRALIYGSVLGVASFIFASAMVATALGELPMRGRPDTVFSFARKYAFPIGGFAGALGGLLYANAKRSRLGEVKSLATSETSLESGRTPQDRNA